MALGHCLITHLILALYCSPNVVESQASIVENTRIQCMRQIPEAMRAHFTHSKALLHLHTKRYSKPEALLILPIHIHTHQSLNASAALLLMLHFSLIAAETTIQTTTRQCMSLRSIPCFRTALRGAHFIQPEAALHHHTEL